MKKLFKALFDFQNECPSIYKGSKNDFGNYKFADLNAYIEGAKPYLKKNGLVITQLLNNGNIVTILFHVESGEQLKCKSYLNTDVTMKGMNPYQVEGSAISYIRKYAYAAILGLATSDNDMAGEEVKTEPETSEHPKLKLIFNMAEFEKIENEIIAAREKGQTVVTIKKRILKSFDGITAEAITAIKNIKI